MPQLKISDVQDEMNKALAVIVERIEALEEAVANRECGCAETSDTETPDPKVELGVDVMAELNKLRADTTVLATNYNNHIVQQHPHKK
jgi:hypothetical protein